MLSYAPFAAILVIVIYFIYTLGAIRRADFDDTVAPPELDVHNNLETWDLQEHQKRVSRVKRRAFMRWVLVSGVLLFVAMLLAGGGSGVMALGRPTNTPTLTITTTPTITATRTVTRTPTLLHLTFTPSTTPTITPTATPVITGTARVIYIEVTRLVTVIVVRTSPPGATRTPGPTRTKPPTRTPGPTRTLYPTYTPYPTWTPYPTDTPTVTVTATATVTETETTTPTPTQGATP